PRTDERNIPEPVSNQLHAAKDEGPHQNFAELGVGLHEGQQTFAIQLDDFARLRGPRADQRTPARDHGGFAGELPGSMDDDEALGGAGWAHDEDLATFDHEERDDLVTGLDEHFPALDRTHTAVSGDPRDLRGGQRRKYVVGARRVNRRWNLRKIFRYCGGLGSASTLLLLRPSRSAGRDGDNLLSVQGSHALKDVRH